MNILLLGPQGSGKGTQGEMIAEKFGLFYFESGNYLRELAKTDPEIDHIVNEVGSLIPDAQMFEIVKKYLLTQNKFDGIVFDGYPRSYPQYQLLAAFLAEHGAKIDHAFVLEIPEDETVRRLSNRRLDPVTHESYNLITNPPPSTVDISTLIHREDDTEPIIRKRLAAYRTVTEPLVEALHREGILVEIDGTKHIDDIFTEISEKIASFV